jgi:hypothetical protein
VSLSATLRAAGASLMGLSLLHAALWRKLKWHQESARLSPLNARVFAVHVFFIAFVLFALGLLSLARPDLLLSPSELSRLLLAAVVVFWLARLVLQPLVFDPVMVGGPFGSRSIRIGASLLWASYAVVYAAALWCHLRASP